MTRALPWPAGAHGTALLAVGLLGRRSGRAASS
jgi:hypothetical protein